MQNFLCGKQFVINVVSACFDVNLNTICRVQYQLITMFVKYLDK